MATIKDWTAPTVLEYEWIEFETYMISQERAPGTMRANRRGWVLFVRFVLEEYKDPKGRRVREIEDLKGRHVTAWVAHRRIAKHNPNTIAVDYRSAKSMFSWWANQKKKRVSPFTGHPVPIPVPRVVPLLDVEWLDGVLKTLKPEKRDRPFTIMSKLRDAALIRVFFDNGGPRLGEQASRSIRNWNGTDVLGMEESKTQVRPQVLSPRTIKAFKLYLIERERFLEHLGRTSEALWINRHGRGLTEAGIYQVVRRRTRGKIFPHALRHNAANLYRINGGDDGAMNQVFGWTPNSKMKDNYTAATAEQRMLAAQRSVNIGDKLR